MEDPDLVVGDDVAAVIDNDEMVVGSERGRP